MSRVRQPAYHYIQRTSAKRRHVVAAITRLHADHKAERAAFVEAQLANVRRALDANDTKAAVQQLCNFIERVWVDT